MCILETQRETTAKHVMRFGTTAVLPSISWISIPISRLFSLNSDITSGFFSQSRPLLSIPLGLSREKIWRQTLFLCLVQIEINLCAVLSSTHGLICAFRGLRLGGFHPVPGTWIVREDLSLAQIKLYQGTGWNPANPPPECGWSWHTLAGPQTCRIASPPT